MPLTALDIKKKEFEQKMRGYDVDDVRKFLDEVSFEVDKLAHYISLESTLEKTLLAAQQTAMKMEDQAKKEAELIMTEARLEKDRSLRDIPLEIERARGEVTRLKAEYEATVVRLKATMEGFARFVETIEKV